MLGMKAPPEFVEAELGKAARGIDEDIAVRHQPAEHAHLVQQRRVLDDEGAGAFRAETRKCLRIALLAKRGNRKHLRRGDYALAAASVDASLEHFFRVLLQSIVEEGRGAILRQVKKMLG